MIVLLLLLGTGDAAARPKNAVDTYAMTDSQGTVWSVQLIPPSLAPQVYPFTPYSAEGTFSCFERPSVTLLSAYGWVAHVEGSWTAWWIPASGETPETTARRHLALGSFAGTIVDLPDGGFRVLISDPRFEKIAAYAPKNFGYCAGDQLGVKVLPPSALQLLAAPKEP